MILRIALGLHEYRIEAQGVLMDDPVDPVIGTLRGQASVRQVSASESHRTKQLQNDTLEASRGHLAHQGQQFVPHRGIELLRCSFDGVLTGC
ncbi:hypothetical protein CG51_07225 [Haematobacter missouriensis]|nr:hypothetical protein CG51_07225 [Haematobacter missouriensis]